MTLAALSSVIDWSINFAHNIFTLAIVLLPKNVLKPPFLVIVLTKTFISSPVFPTPVQLVHEGQARQGIAMDAT